MSADDICVISALRTPICKAKRGAFQNTTPDDLLVAVFRATLERTGIAPSCVEDIVVGNVQLSGSYAGPARMAAMRSGLPDIVPLYTVNRQCSSGLQAVANIAQAIRAGTISVGIAAGVESMSVGGGVADAASSLPPANFDSIMSHEGAAKCLLPMGMTAENVAERYGITREDQVGEQQVLLSRARLIRFGSETASLLSLGLGRRCNVMFCE